MNKEVSYPIAKLLKECKYDKRTDKVFYLDGGECNHHAFDDLGENNSYYWRPTIAEVVMWIYEKHGIWISVKKCYDDIVLLGFEYIIDDDGFIKYEGAFNSPTEAYEAAIKYCLEKII